MKQTREEKTAKGLSQLMKKKGFLKRHKISRKEIKKDVFQFGIPFFVVFLAGLIVSIQDGYHGLLPVLWNVVTEPESLLKLSIENIIGLTLFIGGLTIAIVAVSTLRKYYASTLITREDHQLITHGIYRFTRHPIYLGIIIGIMGIPVYASSWLGVLVMAVLIPIIFNRIRIEERMLVEEFGDAYLSYMATVSKLIPFIY